MPKKIRELKAIVAKVGYLLQAGRGKGSHTYWKHPLLPEEPLTIPGKDGDDAPLYLEKKHSTGAEKAGRTRKTKK